MCIAVCPDLVPMVTGFINDPLFLLGLFPFNASRGCDKPLVFTAGLLADALFSARSEAIHSGRSPNLRASFLGHFMQIVRSSVKARARLMRVCCLIESID